MPSECDCKLRSTWFYDHNEDTIKSLDELFGMYEASVGRGSNFLINVGPDNRGLIPEADAARIHELAEKIKASYSAPIDFAPMIKADDATYFISTEGFDDKGYGARDKARLVNTLVLEEELCDGQAIREFKVYAHLPAYNFKRILVFSGNTVGHKFVCRFPTVNTPKLTVEITSSNGEPRLKDMKAYFVK